MPSRSTGYLREAGAAVLLELLDGATAGTLDAVLSSAAAFAEWLFLPAEVRLPGRVHVQLHSLTLVCEQAADAEALLLAAKLADRLSPSATARCTLLPGARSAALFAKQHLESLLPALLSSTAAHPRVHSVWGALVERLSHEEPAATEVFWEVACENSLFNSSHERKCVVALTAVICCTRTHHARGGVTGSWASSSSQCSCQRCMGVTLLCCFRPTSCGALSTA